MVMGGKERKAMREREVRVESGKERNEKVRSESQAWQEIERKKVFFFFFERERKKEINKIM